MASKPPVTFVLPGDGRSGGVRVTVLMANLLRDRGYPVRIACPRAKVSLRTRVDRLVSQLTHRRSKSHGFLHLFGGPTEWYRSLDGLTYASTEIVIAVGTYTVEDVRRLRAPVLKLRFNHGFPAKPDAAQAAAWTGRMPTITVSHTLVPKLQQLTEGSVLGVVPNGIDTTEYFVESGIARDGLGAVYNGHPNKAPEDLIAVLRAAHQRWPELPQRIFSTERAPAGLEHTRYTRLPAVDAARRIYNQSKLWLLTSRTEGLPGVVLEAMACGCVVISSDNDGSLEIIADGVNGVVAPRGDREAFLARIELLLTQPTELDRLAKGAVARAKEFTWARAAEKMEAILATLAERDSAERR